MRLLPVFAAACFFLVACGSNGASFTVPQADTGAGSGHSTTSTNGTDPANGGGADGANETTTNGGVTVKALAPSCATRATPHGGQTCGPNGNEDCCQIASQGDTKLGKYMVTAGRMRTFIQHFNGDVASYVKTLPADKWQDAWNTDAIPTDIDSANAALGPAGKKACEQGGFTGHTYWTPKTDDDFSDFDQSTLDEKALNCVPWELLQALCTWDGGHLATSAELKAAFTNNGSTRYPWGNDDLASLSAPDDQNRLNIEGAFETSPLPATFRQRDDGQPEEISFIIAPPGRFPAGNNQAGVADSAGNLLEWVGDQPRQFVWKADFEEHAKDAASMNGGYFWMDAQPVVGSAWVWGDGQLLGNAGTADQRDGYYAIGGRCAF